MSYYVPTVTDNLNTMVDNVNVMDGFITTGVKSIQAVTIVYNCCEALTSLCADAGIIASGTSLTPITTAIADGVAFTGINV